MSSSRLIAGHPPGLMTLFFTEMWERASYYGMRALLVLFMSAAVANGGLGLDEKTATAIYGLYTAFVYLLPLAGGWIADRLLGAQRSVWYGGMLIALGHFTIAIPRTEAFFLGLVLVVLGTGLLKPNISAIVGQLYPEGGARRDAGFTIFYMGINLGAAVGPLVCSALGERLNWHYGFGAAGVGMVLGLVQYHFTAHQLGEAGRYPARRRDPSEGTDPGWYLVIAGVAAIGVLVAAFLLRIVTIDPVWLAKQTTYLISAVGLVYFLAIMVLGGLNTTEMRRMVVLAVLLLGCSLFWAGFEQAGSSLTVFAKNFTVRQFGGLPEIPAGWFQTVNPVFIISLSPVLAAVWVALAKRERNPSIPAKFALGLIFMGGGFFVMAAASELVSDTKRVWPTWLILTYLLHTIGELCLSPVGLSAVTKLAPARFVGQMMGLWFVATSLGNLIAGLVASEAVESAAQMPAAFTRLGLWGCGAGVVLLLISWPLLKFSGKIE